MGVSEQDEVEGRDVEVERRAILGSASPPPWNRPQSTRKRSLAASTRKQEPVTSRAAPRNVMRMVVHSTVRGTLRIEVVQICTIALAAPAPEC